jgi:MYXO-CTERM domain-containing protein
MTSIHTKRRTAAIVTTALALATVTAPASARPFDFNANGSFVQLPVPSTQAPAHPGTSATVSPCSEACSGLGYGTPRGINWQLVQNGGAGAQSPPHTASPSTRSRGARGSDDETAYVAIGGGAAGLALLGIGGIAVARRRERQRTMQRRTIAA